MDVADTTVMFFDDGHQNFFLFWVGEIQDLDEKGYPWSGAAELRPPFPAKTSINILRYSFGAGFSPCENLRPSPAESMARWLFGSRGRRRPHIQARVTRC